MSPGSPFASPFTTLFGKGAEGNLDYKFKLPPSAQLQDEAPLDTNIVQFRGSPMKKKLPPAKLAGLAKSVKPAVMKKQKKVPYRAFHIGGGSSSKTVKDQKPGMTASASEKRFESLLSQFPKHSQSTSSLTLSRPQGKVNKNWFLRPAKVTMASQLRAGLLRPEEEIPPW
jgi:hypothetical protein